MPQVIETLNSVSWDALSPLSTARFFYGACCHTPTVKDVINYSISHNSLRHFIFILQIKRDFVVIQSHAAGARRVVRLNHRIFHETQ